MGSLSHEKDVLDPARLAAKLQHTIFSDLRNIRHFSAIGSTNTAAMQAAMQGAPEGSIFLAEEQLAGRGRGGHSWHSQAGAGIYMSVILRPKVEAPAALALSLIAGIAVHDAISEVCGVNPDLRWPNDVLIGPKKVAGILTESSADMQRLHHAVVGLGINVNQTDFPSEISAQATSLRLETGRECQREELVIALLESLDLRYRALSSEPVSAVGDIIRDFESRSSFVRDTWIEVHERDAAEPQYCGKTVGLDARGFLQIKTDSGVRTLLSGGIRKVSGMEQD